MWTAAGVTGGHRWMLRRYSQAVTRKHHVSGPPNKQLRDGWPDAAVIITSGAGLLHAGPPCGAAGQSGLSSPNSLLLPSVSQRLQKQTGHGETLAHTHRRETFQMPILSTPISYQGKPESPHEAYSHGHHRTFLMKNGWHCPCIATFNLIMLQC